MFDPLRITTTNKRIQQRSQIIRSKGYYEIPNNVIDKRQMDRWARILKANHISAFIPPTTPILPLILKSLTITFTEAQPIEVQCNIDFLENDFTLCSEDTQIEVPGKKYLLRITHHDSQDWVLNIYNNYGEQIQHPTIYAGEWYYLGSQQSMNSITFNVYPLNDPKTIVPLFALDTQNDDTTEVAFNSETFIPGIVRE